MQISLLGGVRPASMTMTMTVTMAVSALLGCTEDETATDAGVGAGGNGSGGQATGGSGGNASGGNATGGNGAGGANGGHGGTGGAFVPDAAVPDAAVPDAAVITCPPDVLPEVVDLNLHADGDGFRYLGDTTSATNRTQSPCGGDEAPDVLHRFVAPRDGNWRIDTESTDPKWDTLLSMRETCLDTASPTCNDDGAYPPLSQLNTQLVQGQEIFVVVDGHTGGASPDRGAYVLTVTPR